MREKVRERTRLSGNQTSENGHSIHSSLPAAAIDQKSREKVTPDPVAAPLHMSSTEFTTAMVHFYRGELQRSNTWRNRLDMTTNWAVITTGATLSFVFSSTTNPAFVIPINSILVAIFLFMEARRYRYYEVWANRVRVIETGYFAPMLSPRSVPKDQEWAEHVAADLMSPHFTISEWEAVGRRLRSNYIWIFILLALSYNLKVYIHPFPAPNFDTFMSRAEVGLIPGWIVFAVGFFFNVTLFCFAVFTIRLKEAASEVLPHSEFSWHPLRRMTDWTRNATSIRRQATERRADRARRRVKQTSDIHKTETANKL
ncbi:MAG: DUF2270 domain-containing protein [Pyrinomonadaceae bacterium]